MNDFEYDCLQKKQLAGQAKYRKRGSKSKKCTLPSDTITHKQWKERCGPVVVYKMNEPISWDAFKQMPSDIQAEYITNLQQKYGATAVDLGEMFGVRALTVRKHAEANGLGVVFPRGHAMNPRAKVDWMRFLGEEETSETTDSAGVQETAGVISSEDAAETGAGESTQNRNPLEPACENTAAQEPSTMRMHKFSVQFHGAMDIDAIANSLRLILGDSACGDIEITCNIW